MEFSRVSRKKLQKPDSVSFIFKFETIGFGCSFLCKQVLVLRANETDLFVIAMYK